MHTASQHQHRPPNTHQGSSKTAWLAFFAPQTSPWGARGKSGREINWMFTFFCSYYKALENITFCIFQERLVQAWAKRLHFYCFSYASQAECIDLHPYTLQGIDLGRLWSPASHLGSSARELSAWLQTEAQVQTTTYEAQRIDNPSRETEKNPTDRVDVPFRACCGACRSRDEGDEHLRQQSASAVSMQGYRGHLAGWDRTWLLQRRCALSHAVVYAESACSILGSNMDSQALSFPTSINFTFKVKYKELLLAFFSAKVYPRKQMTQVSLGLKMTQYPSGYYPLLRLGRRSPNPTTGLQHVCGHSTKAAVGVWAQHPVRLCCSADHFYLLLIFKCSETRSNTLASLLQTLSLHCCS